MLYSGSEFFQIALSFRLVLKVSEVWLRKPVRKGEVWPMGDRSLCSDSDFFNSARNEKSYENFESKNCIIVINLLLNTLMVFSLQTATVSAAVVLHSYRRVHVMQKHQHLARMPCL